MPATETNGSTYIAKYIPYGHDMSPLPFSIRTKKYGLQAIELPAHQWIEVNEFVARSLQNHIRQNSADIFSPDGAGLEERLKTGSDLARMQRHRRLDYTIEIKKKEDLVHGS